MILETDSLVKILYLLLPVLLLTLWDDLFSLKISEYVLLATFLYGSASCSLLSFLIILISFFTDSGISLNDLLGLRTLIWKWIEFFLSSKILEECSDDAFGDSILPDHKRDYIILSLFMISKSRKAYFLLHQVCF